MAREKSERVVVAMKRGNEHPKDPVERRTRRITEPLEGKMEGTQGPQTVSTKQQRIAKLARQMPDEALTSLSQHIDIEWMKEAVRRTRKKGATGIDGQTAEEYERNLEENLRTLIDRAKGGNYRAPPVKRVHIPKGGGATRPIGIPTYEDKVLQRAVVMALEPVYEQMFHDCSYGFRPQRSAHQALESFWKQMMGMRGGWVLEVDIKSFFDTLEHKHLQDIIRQRVNDGVVLRLIGKWLNAGVMEDGAYKRPEAGTPQGGVISPLLANIYLHEVLDEWFEREVKPRMRGKAFLVRYADDFVIGFTNEEDARRVRDVIPKRFEKYGLELHPEKTRLVHFEPPEQGGGGGGSFNFLGFTHFWGRSSKGTWVIRKKTAKGRLAKALRSVWEWCRDNRHRPVMEQRAKLNAKLRGHYAYYGVTGNFMSLQNFAHKVRRAWQRWLGRRTCKRMTWERYEKLLSEFPLARPTIVHSTMRRFAKP